jgi:hypothetical protein
MTEQIIIAFCGLLSVFLSQDKRPNWSRFACLFGLFAQPFWMYATWKAQQWGIFGLSFIYAAGWIRGIYNFWYLPSKEAFSKDNWFPSLILSDAYKAEQEEKNRRANAIVEKLSEESHFIKCPEFRQVPWSGKP